MSYFDEFLKSCISADGQQAMRNRDWVSWGSMRDTTEEEIRVVLAEDDAAEVLQHWTRHFGSGKPLEPRLTLTSPHKPGDLVWCLWAPWVPKPTPKRLGRAARSREDKKVKPVILQVKIKQVTLLADLKGETAVYRVSRCRCVSCGFRSLREVFNTEQEARDRFKELYPAPLT